MLPGVQPASTCSTLVRRCWPSAPSVTCVMLLMHGVIHVAHSPAVKLLTSHPVVSLHRGSACMNCAAAHVMPEHLLLLLMMMMMMMLLTARTCLGGMILSLKVPGTYNLPSFTDVTLLLWYRCTLQPGPNDYGVGRAERAPLPRQVVESVSQHSTVTVSAQGAKRPAQCLSSQMVSLLLTAVLVCNTRFAMAAAATCRLSNAHLYGALRCMLDARWIPRNCTFGAGLQHLPVSPPNAVAGIPGLMLYWMAVRTCRLRQPW
jgi:hypothetical protein